MRVVQHGAVLARLVDVRRDGDRLFGLWLGEPPPFEPWQQIEPFVVESDDGLERHERWLCRACAVSESRTEVELGPEREAPPWRRSSATGTCAASRTELTPRVLVVDDDPDILDVVVEALELEGWDVLRADSGKQALSLLSVYRPDVAVVDLIMPEVSGEEICNAIRRAPELAATRVLVLSAAEDTRMVAAHCDADSAVTKPFTVPLLLREVKRLLGS